jgi:rhamnosyltransferase
VSILVSTYNGEKYITEQLDSLIVQSYKNIHIYIRDDGSKDGTYSILQRYAALYPDLISISKGSNLGVIGSFNHLMESTSSDLYATCDQDDIWLPNKIMEQVKAYKTNFSLDDSPFMCFSDPILYKNSIRSDISLSDVQLMNIRLLISSYKNLIAMNPVAGCTMLFCNNAKRLYSRSMGNGHIMHDHLMAVLVSLHGKIVFCNKEHVLYRQHDFNVLGNKDTSVRYFLNRLANIFSLVKHDLELLNTVNSNFIDKTAHIFRKVYLNVRRFGGFR